MTRPHIALLREDNARRMVAEGRRGKKKPRPVTSFIEAFKTACRKAGCPCRLGHSKFASSSRCENKVSETDLQDAAATLDAADVRDSSVTVTEKPAVHATGLKRIS